jgi:hypothetical protein
MSHGENVNFTAEAQRLVLNTVEGTQSFLILFDTPRSLRLCGSFLMNLFNGFLLCQFYGTYGTYLCYTVAQIIN